MRRASSARSVGPSTPANRRLAAPKPLTGTRTAARTRASVRVRSRSPRAPARRLPRRAPPRPRSHPSGAPGTDPAGVTVGVLGGSWRVGSRRGAAVVPADGSATLDWWIAAEDRWHTPASEPTVRQRAVEGVPVVETAVRVPGGDVVQTVYAVADGGGFTVIELENRSPAGVAVALSRRDLVTSRPPATVPVEGVDAPADALVVPIGHHASARVALAHDGGVGAARPEDLPPPGGGRAGLDRAGRAGGGPPAPRRRARVGLTVAAVCPAARGPAPAGRRCGPPRRRRRAGSTRLGGRTVAGRRGGRGRGHRPAGPPLPLGSAGTMTPAWWRRGRCSNGPATGGVRPTSSPSAAGSRRPSPRRWTRRRGRWAWPGPSAGSSSPTPTARRSTCSRRPSPGRGPVSRSRPTASRSAAIRP